MVRVQLTRHTVPCAMCLLAAKRLRVASRPPRRLGRVAGAFLEPLRAQPVDGERFEPLAIEDISRSSRQLRSLNAGKLLRSILGPFANAWTAAHPNSAGHSVVTPPTNVFVHT